MDQENVLESVNINGATEPVPEPVAGEEECCGIPCLMICGPVFASYFIIVGIIGFAISAGLYNSSKKEGFVYEGPGADVIAFHWMCVIGGIGLGIGFFIVPISPKKGIWISGGSGVVILVFYICYLVFFTVSDQYKLISDAALISLADLKTQWNRSREVCPYVGVYGSAYRFESGHYGRRGRDVPCSTNELRLTSDDDCHDETQIIKAIADVDEIPKTGYKVHTSIAYTFADDAYCYAGITQAKTDGMDCLEKMSGLNTREVHVTIGISGLSPVVVVTNDGKLPSFVSKTRALSAAIFFAGVLYSYEVSKIPVLRQEFTKTNVNITYERPVDACTVMGSCK